MPNKKPASKKPAKKKKVERDVTEEFTAPKVNEINIREFKWTAKQKSLISLIMEPTTNVVFLKGPAGTAKSLVSVFCGLKMLQEKVTPGVVYMRSVVESAAKGIGFLPGDSDDKTGPFFQSLMEKMDELVDFKQTDALLESGLIKAISNHFLRGVQFRSFVIVDEAQGFEKFELTTIMTRIATGGKMIFIGDPDQSDIRKSGFQAFYDLFNSEAAKEHGIHTFSFDKNDIMRSKILNFVCTEIEGLK